MKAHIYPAKQKWTKTDIISYFKHDSSTGQYWSKANADAESKHTGSNPETDYKYSRLDGVEEFGRTDEGFLQFKLEYPTLSQTNIWKQTSNPVTASGRGVDGFEAISVEANGHGTSTHSFKGLEHNSGSANFIDGTVDHGNWFFSIGAYQAWGGANNFPGPSSGVNLVKLWVKTSAKKPDTCPSPPSPPPVLDCDATIDEDGYYLVFKHDSSTGQYWSKANADAESKHTGSNPETDYKYSRLDGVEEFGRTDEGFLQFKLEYPTLSQTNIWKQTSNPVTASGRGVDGFEAISVEANGHGTSTHSFKGLEHNSGSANFIDGTVDHGNWFFSIGAYQAWGGANNFPGPSSGVNLVKLWVKTSAKKPDTCLSPPTSLPSTYSSYEILEGGVTCESKGWVTILDIDECQVAGATLSGDSNKGFRYDQPEGGYTTVEQFKNKRLHVPQW